MTVHPREIDRAIAIATEAHAGQTDKGGQPYILHPLRLMEAVSDPAAKVVAVLHDVLEDCDGWSAARLVSNGISPAAAAAVAVLTKRPGESYGEFIERVAANPIATAVKRADLKDNMDLTRLGREPTDKDLARLAKYRAALDRLDGAPGVSSTSNTHY